jgi:hypothetical protein
MPSSKALHEGFEDLGSRRETPAINVAARACSAFALAGRLLAAQVRLVSMSLLSSRLLHNINGLDLHCLGRCLDVWASAMTITGCGKPVCNQARQLRSWRV